MTVEDALTYCLARRGSGLLLLRPRKLKLPPGFKASFRMGKVKLSDKTWTPGPQARHHPHLEVLEKGAEEFLKSWGYQSDFTRFELEQTGQAVEFAAMWLHPWGKPCLERLAERLDSGRPMSAGEGKFWRQVLERLARPEPRRGRRPLPLIEMARRDFKIICHFEAERAAGYETALERAAHRCRVSISEVTRALGRRRREGAFNSPLRRVS